MAAGQNANTASGLQPSTTPHGAQPSGQESTLRSDADYECSGQEPKRTPVHPISSDPDPKRNSDPEVVAPFQP
jgi:hypothetical protein